MKCYITYEHGQIFQVKVIGRAQMISGIIDVEICASISQRVKVPPLSEPERAWRGCSSFGRDDVRSGNFARSALAPSPSPILNFCRGLIS